MPLTLHESQEDQRGEPGQRHGEQQDATATAPVYGRPQQQPGTAPCADGQQVRPIEAGGGASDVTSERAVTVTNAVGDESEREKEQQRHKNPCASKQCSLGEQKKLFSEEENRNRQEKVSKHLNDESVRAAAETRPVNKVQLGRKGLLKHSVAKYVSKAEG